MQDSMKFIMVCLLTKSPVNSNIDNIYIGKRNADFVWQSVPVHI